MTSVMRNGISHSAHQHLCDVLPHQGGSRPYEARQHYHQHHVGQCRYAQPAIACICNDERSHSELYRRARAALGREGDQGELRGTRTDLDASYSFHDAGREGERVGKQVPMQRPGQPKELAPVYVMLATDEASYVSGATIAVTGGKPII